MTKKEIEVVRREAIGELYGVLLILDYGIEDLEILRDEVRETAKYITKEIASNRKAFNKLKAKYEEASGRKYTPRKK